MKSHLKFHLVAINLIVMSISSFAQVCYPTSIVDNAHGTSANMEYDDQNNLKTLTITVGQLQTTYDVTSEKTPTGYKRIFTVNKVDSTMALIAVKAVMTYDKSNRLLQTESSTGMGIHGVDKFIYNANDQLTQINSESTYKDPSGKLSNDNGRIDYSYPNPKSKNPSEIKTYGIVNDKPGLQLIKHDVLTYDNDKTINNIEVNAFFSLNPVNTYAVNNVLTLDTQYVNSSTKVKQTYTYTFNEQGYPISKSYQFSGAPNTDNYSYDCK